MDDSFTGDSSEQAKTRPDAPKKAVIWLGFLFGINLLLGTLFILNRYDYYSLVTSSYGEILRHIVRTAWLLIALGAGGMLIWGILVLLNFSCPRLKRVCGWLFLGAVFLYFLPGSVFDLNAKLDRSPPQNLPGKIISIEDKNMAVVKLEIGGKVAVALSDEDHWRLGEKYPSLVGRSLPGLVETYALLAKHRGGKKRPRYQGQPEIEVFEIHRGLFGLSWQEKPGYRLLPAK